jgi:hypothetical protein
MDTFRVTNTTFADDDAPDVVGTVAGSETRVER